LDMTKNQANNHGRLKRSFVYCVGVSRKFYQENHIINGCSRFGVASWSFQHKKTKKNRNYSFHNTCILWQSLNLTLFHGNNLVMNPFKMNQVRCTSIGTTISNGLALVSHLSIVTKAKGIMV